MQNARYWQGLHDSARGQFSVVGYSSLGEGFNRAAYRLRFAAAKRLLELAFPTKQIESVLEIGVGTGAYEQLWTEYNRSHWFGVDVSRKAVDALSLRHPESTFLCVDITSANWSSHALLNARRDAFALVTGIDVLYHLVDDTGFQTALGTMTQFVQPGGYLLLSDVFVPESIQIASHVKRRAMSDYEALLRPAGFELTGRVPIFGFLGDPVRRPGFHALDEMLFLAWRLLSKGISITPQPMRDFAGAGIVATLAPVERALLATGWTRGINLELALFRRKDLDCSERQR